MFRFLVLSALMACAYGSVILPKVALPDGRIVGGVDTTIEEHPHQVSVRFLGGHYCGGSIIGSRKILTAAHCCGYAASWYKVQHGVTKIGTSDNVLSVAKVIKHPGYNSQTIDNDACILILDSDIVFNNKAQPIKLAENEPSANAKAVVTGWGALKEGGSSPSTLQSVGVDITGRDACHRAYASYGGITDAMVCAGVNGGGKDACQGDSGGPLVSGGELVGIVSWGVGCAQALYPGVYTNVAALRAWIDSTNV